MSRDCNHNCQKGAMRSRRYVFAECQAVRVLISLPGGSLPAAPHRSRHRPLLLAQSIDSPRSRIASAKAAMLGFNSRALRGAATFYAEKR